MLLLDRLLCNQLPRYEIQTGDGEEAEMTTCALETAGIHHANQREEVKHMTVKKQ